MSIDELLIRIIDVFNERDSAKRAAGIAELFTEDVVFADPEGEVRGREALAAKVSALLDAQPPTFVFGEVHAPQTAGDLGIHRWNLGPAGGDPVASGVDIIMADGDRISRLWTVLD
jgi:ketosteroid isomerase-like protein